MRPTAAAFALFAVAAATPAFAKPPAGADDSDRALYRLQAVGACVAARTAGRTYEADDANILADCQCAVDRFIADRDVATLPRLIPGQDKGLLDEPFAQCRGERRGERRSPAAPTDPRELRPTAGGPAAPDAGGVDPAAGPPTDEGDKSPGFDPIAWLSGLGLPGRAWWAIPGVAMALLLFALFRRRRRADDLLGPPRSMRPNARPGPRSTWPIDDR